MTITCVDGTHLRRYTIMNMKFGDKAIFKITDIDKKGRGCGTVGTRKVCVPFAVPGEEVEARMVARKQGVVRMEIDRVITPSPARVTPRCPYAGRCGGCAWQQFDYALQLEMKRSLVNKSLASCTSDATIDAVIPSPSLYYYRNRMDYGIGPNGELGLKEPGRWNAYVDLDTCYLLSPESVEVMRIFRTYLREENLEPWNVRTHTGYARYLVIREGKNSGTRMVMIVTSTGALPNRERLITSLQPFATTIYHGINPTITDLSIASELELLHGAPLLEERVDGKTFQIPVNSFFQTNTEMAGRLIATAREFLADRPPETLLDLYCGVGLFGICLASSAKKIIGVELDADAITLARANAAANGVTNATFIAAKAEDLLWRGEQADTVIIDPPRAGLHPKVAETLLTLAPERILYVSCNHESFARDFAALGKKYRITKSAALDLFPHSPHVELIVLLERNL